MWFNCTVYGFHWSVQTLSLEFLCIDVKALSMDPLKWNLQKKSSWNFRVYTRTFFHMHRKVSGLNVFCKRNLGDLYLRKKHSFSRSCCQNGWIFAMARWFVIVLLCFCLFIRLCYKSYAFLRAKLKNWRGRNHNMRGSSKPLR